MIELADGIFVAPEHVAMIKAAGENQCVLWFLGQSALDGFVLDYPASQVAEVINDYLGEEDVEEEDEEE
jgi:hypothetical protein